jgi:hypothetical protein
MLDPLDGTKNLELARNQAQVQAQILNDERRFGLVQESYKDLAAWLARCDDEILMLNRVLWEAPPENDPESVKSGGKLAFDRPAEYSRHDYIWSKEVWEKLRVFFKTSEKFWKSCRRLHEVTMESEHGPVDDIVSAEIYATRPYS